MKIIKSFTPRHIADLYEVHQVVGRWDTDCPMSGEIQSTIRVGFITVAQFKSLGADCDGEFATADGTEYVAIRASLEVLNVVEA